MIKRYGIVILVLLLALLSGCSQVNIKSAEYGLLDLTDQDFDDHSIYKMRGDWKISWKQFLDPTTNLENHPELNGFVSVPQTWKEKKLGDETAGQYGFGTLVLNVKTNTDDVLAIKTTYITSAFEIYANGRKIASNGTPGISPGTTKAMWNPIVGSFKPESDQTQIVIHFSNFNHRRFVIKDLYIGTEAAITKHKTNRLALDIMLASSIFILALYHFVVYYLRKKDHSSLFFSLMCGTFALRIIIVGDRYIYELIPNLNWEIFMKFAYSTYYIALLFLMFFISRTFTHYRIKQIEKWVIIGTLSIVAITIVTPASFFDQFLTPFFIIMYTILLYCLWITFKSLKNSETGSLMAFVGILFFFLGSCNDALYESGIIGTTSLTPVAFVVLIFTQAYILAKRFAFAYNTSERLLEENKRINLSLNKQNEHLEEIIEDRTKEIKGVNEVLKTSNQELTQMVEAVNKSEAHFKSLFENMPVGVFRYSNINGFQMINPKLADIFGYTKPENLMNDLNNRSFKMIDDRLKWNQFVRNFATNHSIALLPKVDMVTKDEKKIIVEVTSQIVEQVGEEIFTEGTITDITNRITIENELHRLAFTDVLTGLNNRRLFTEALEHIQPNMALALIDIDDFKTINDTYSHDIGDLVIKETAQRILRSCNDKHFVARIGGEEFAIIFDLSEPHVIHKKLEHIKSAISEFPLKLGDESISFTISIGICMNTAYTTHQTCYKNANLALFKAKSFGKNQIVTSSTDSIMTS